ncbi:MAG: SUMF1/EgtB/PvdO family nonheme iron enzyme [Candidatus Rokubacteria bacterium]|nr:SUMF1/EgtB/PvdO family nonheme iron enzyme [Candidatus Rokubacteria bacterium]
MSRFAVLCVLASSLVATVAHADGIMFVPAGAFWMGRDGGSPDETPFHRVHVADFWIERHKVTNGEFATFLNARGLVSRERERRFDHDDADARVRLIEAGGPDMAPRPPTLLAPRQSRGAPRQPARWVADAGYEHHPAVEVSWFGARDYCAWRGRRLPTEAEWEKAARGDDWRVYPWGAAAPSPERAVYGRPYNATERGDVRPQGASPYRVEDMIGNLREWTATILKPYPYRADDGREPFTGAAGSRVVVRGASHDDPAEALGVTTRSSYDRRGAAAGHHHVGFRCATSEDLGEVAPGGR